MSNYFAHITWKAPFVEEMGCETEDVKLFCDDYDSAIDAAEWYMDGITDKYRDILQSLDLMEKAENGEIRKLDSIW